MTRCNALSRFGRFLPLSMSLTRPGFPRSRLLLSAVSKALCCYS